MKASTVALLATAFALALALAGCSKGGNDTSNASNASSGSSASGSSSSPAAAIPAVSPYDNGPRAGEASVNDELAESGEKLFQTKGCSACHAFGKKMSGPDLQGVSMRRTALWMENQILHPDVMVKTDPIARQLFAQMSLQMPNQGLTPEEARSVIEFLKHEDREAGLAPSSK